MASEIGQAITGAGLLAIAVAILPSRALSQRDVQGAGAGNLAEVADFLDGRAELPESRVDLAGLLAERAAHEVDFGE